MSTDIKYRKKPATNFFTVAPGVWGMKDVFVNIYMILNPFDGNWVLVDAGLKWSAPKIKKMAEQLFGDDAKPSAIILTHAHFDHVGSLQKLAEEWNVPVYAHYLEIPYLTGKSSYPPPDPSVGGGLMSLMSWTFPNDPINIWNHVNVLPEDGVPGLPEWRYIHTPGHAPGHISLYRESDGVLIAGDAFVTTQQESAFSVMFQLKKVSGPPRYFTYDWEQARESVKNLMKLEPEIVATGHGKPMHGSEIRRLLHKLSEQFYDVAKPSSGRYVDDPAVADATGFIYVPENNVNKRSLIIKTLLITAVAATAYVLLADKIKKTKKQKAALAYEVW